MFFHGRRTPSVRPRVGIIFPERSPQVVPACCRAAPLSARPNDVGAIRTARELCTDRTPCGRRVMHKPPRPIRSNAERQTQPPLRYSYNDSLTGSNACATVALVLRRFSRLLSLARHTGFPNTPRQTIHRSSTEGIHPHRQPACSRGWSRYNDAHGRAAPGPQRESPWLVPSPLRGAMGVAGFGPKPTLPHNRATSQFDPKAGLLSSASRRT